MFGVIFATVIEAKVFLKLIDAYLIAKKPFLLFRSSNIEIAECVVIISGLGKISAAAATLELILVNKVNFVINAGIGGLLNENFYLKIGKIYRISFVVESSIVLSGTRNIVMMPTNLFFNNLSEAVLITTDKSIFDNKLKDRASVIADLVDMEAGTILRISKIYGISCDIIKGVSDFANKKSVNLMKCNINRISNLLAYVLIEKLSSV